MARRIAAIIPARYHSTRLPGKPLADIAGKPMIQRVYERVAQAAVAEVVVATDDARIREAVAAFGGRVVMTSPDHPSGTDRVAEAARALDVEIVVNVQGDEPLLNPAMIDQVAAPLAADPAIPMSTLAHPITEAREVASPDVVKVVCDRNGFALYFSRAPIPFVRDLFGHHLPHTPERVVEGRAFPEGMLRHVGLYAFQAGFLQEYAALPPTFLEQQERLEQLRALENGFRIRVVETVHQVIGVDTPADLERVRNLYAGGAAGL